MKNSVRVIPAWFLVILFFLNILLGCGSHDRNLSSAIVILVDKLGVDKVFCSEEESNDSGFQDLCLEAIRFTHAFTTSPLSVPATASVLTAKYPYQMKIHSNFGGLPSSVETLPEKLVGKGVRTAFFSGGGAIWRKSNLNQGFELFDDHVTLSANRLYKPVDEVTQGALSWIAEESGSFLAVLYLPDANFLTVETQNHLGEIRNRSYESQIEEIDESLHVFFSELKKNHKWDSSLIVLAGLNGRPRRGELPSLDLHTENTQVALLIKPPSAKFRDKPVNWKVDTNVSLVDVGQTLMDFFGLELGLDEDFQKLSLKALFSSPELPIQSKPILLEATEVVSNREQQTRFGMRKNQWFYLHETNPIVFNTLSDRNENSPLSSKDAVAKIFLNSAKIFFDKQKIEAFRGSDQAVLEKYQVDEQISEDKLTASELLNLFEALDEKGLMDEALQIRRAQILRQRGHWEKILKLKLLPPIVSFVAQANLGKEGGDEGRSLLFAAQKSAQKAEACIVWFASGASEDKRNCDDELFTQVVSSGGEQEGGIPDKVIRDYLWSRIDEKIYWYNRGLGRIWSVSERMRQQNVFVDWILWHPRLQKIRQALEKNKIN